MKHRPTALMLHLSYIQFVLENHSEQSQHVAPRENIQAQTAFENIAQLLITHHKMLTDKKVKKVQKFKIVSSH